MRGFGEREAATLYADQFEIYHGNSNPGLARKICRYLGTQPGRAEVFQFANENIFVKILDNVRERDVYLVGDALGRPAQLPLHQRRAGDHHRIAGRAEIERRCADRAETRQDGDAVACDRRSTAGLQACVTLLPGNFRHDRG